MKTRHGYNYWIDNGKYTVDGYDFFDTLDELEADIDWQQLWAAGKARKDENGWHLVEDTTAPVVYPLTVFARDSMTGEFFAAFASMAELRKAWPGAEIVSTERQNDGTTVVYC